MPEEMTDTIEQEESTTPLPDVEAAKAAAEAKEKAAADVAKSEGDAREEAREVLARSGEREEEKAAPKPKKTRGKAKAKAEPEPEPAPEKEDDDAKSEDAEEPEKKEPEGLTLSDEMKARAEASGVPEDKLAAMGSETAAEILLASMEQQAGAALLKSRKTGETTEQPPADKPDTETTPPAKTDDAATPDALNWGSEDDAMDIPDVVRKHIGDVHAANKALQVELETNRKQFAEQATVVERIQQQFDASQAAYVQAEADRFIGELGEDWEPVFGKGPTSHIDPESAEGKARQALFVTGGEINQLHASRNQQDLPIPEALRRGLHSRFASKVEQVGRKRIARNVKKRTAQATALPTDRSPDDIAVDADKVERDEVRKILERPHVRGR